MSDKPRGTHTPEVRELDGVVVSIRYANHPRYIATLRDKGTHTVTIIGSYPERLFEGSRVRGTFRKENHETYGVQYRAVRVTVEADYDANFRTAVIDLLSRRLRGIGPKTATALVDAFGRRVFEALERPDELAQLPGFSEKRARDTVAAWRELRREIEDLLPYFELGIAEHQVELVKSHLGENALERLHENVYELTRVPGIGFKTADKIALVRLGYAAKDPRRLSAAAQHILWRAHEYGDTAPTKEMLDRIGRRELGLSQGDIEDGLSYALREGLIVEKAGHYGLPHAYAIEADIIEALRDHLLTPIKLLTTLKPDGAAPLTDQQRVLFDLVAKNPVVYLTGLPGTGKSYTLGQLARACKRLGLRVVGLAPTGKAAIRMREGQPMETHTVHRALGHIPIRGHWPEPPEPVPNPLLYDVVIVDEASMMDTPMMRALLRSSTPGKTRLVFVGDPNQLPPVGPGEPFRNLLEVLPGVHLKEVFRQAAGNPIVRAAHDIAAGKEPKEETGDARLQIPRLSEDDLDETAFRDAFHDLWALAGTRPQILVPGNRGSLGVFALNKLVKSLVNPGREDEGVVIGHEQTIHPGDVVIATRNNYKLGVMNGEIGTVLEASMDERGKRLMVDFSGKTIAFENARDLMDLLPAYAITVHRSQGSQWPAVMLVLTTKHYTLLNRELLYTALTRAERFALVWGSRKALQVALKRRASQRQTWLPLFTKGEVEV